MFADDQLVIQEENCSYHSLDIQQLSYLGDASVKEINWFLMALIQVVK